MQRMYFAIFPFFSRINKWMFADTQIMKIMLKGINIEKKKLFTSHVPTLMLVQTGSLQTEKVREETEVRYVFKCCSK